MSISDLSDGVEVSNACRRFYVSRLQAAEVLKKRLTSDCATYINETDTLKSRYRQMTKPESFQTAMALLRSELASLIDVDLEVMRQLLMLNDQVEELKWQRRRSLTDSINISSPAYDLLDVDGSSWSRDDHHNNRWSFEVSTLDRSPMTPFSRGALSKYPTPSALSLLRASSQDCCSSIEDMTDYKVNKTAFDSQSGESCTMKLFINNNSKEQTSYEPKHSRAAQDHGGDEANVTQMEEKWTGRASSVVMTSKCSSPAKEKPAVKPKPLKSVASKGGELRVSFVTSVSCKSPETTSVSAAGSSLSPIACCNTTSSNVSNSPVADVPKEEVIMRKVAARVDRNSEKVEKTVKLKDSAVHSGGTDSFHELSAFVEMLI